MTERPSPTEHHPYVDLVPEGDLLATLDRQAAETGALLIDTERIFGVRALRIARGDTTPLPGYHQDAYVAALDLSARPLAALADEFERLRATTVDLFRSFSDEALMRVGTVNDGPMSARAAAWIIAGHERHHIAILRQRYIGERA